jgi:hypothetical protein
MRTVSKIGLLAIIVSILSISAGCDPEQTVNNYFAQQGLNRLAVVRDDIQPGGLVIANSKGAMYADNMFDYTTKPPSAEYTFTAGDGTAEYKAVLRSFTQDRNIDPSVAVKFLASMIPADLGNEFKFNDKVMIDLTQATVRRMKIPVVQSYLNSNASGAFRAAVSQFVQDGKTSAYLVYETWRAKKLKIQTESGKDISNALEIGAVKVIASATGKFSYKRTSKSEIELTGDKFYVFAIRTGMLEKNGDNFKFKPMDFLKPNGWGVKAAGTDIQYSAPINEDFSAVTLLSEIP